MKILSKIIVVSSVLSVGAFAKYQASISPINKKIEQRMRQGNSYRDGCPVNLKNLRYLRLTYLGFDGKEHIGEMVVNRAVASDVVSIFKTLYEHHYPIRKIYLVSRYNGDDFRSIEADNTSAFNCRQATGSKKWSNHAYGRAIDLNPLENPYISHNGYIAHKASLKYRTRRHLNNRTPQDKALVVSGDFVVNIFKRHGWKWGGDWHSIKDYQHFEKR